ncbi:aspartate aminotransferase family protein [Sphingobium sp. Cam5-1]|uniref:aspartate aminotransferase family protein n=1 Tax=Sphingobium sp. Cam5-1 TaxID=2789327 RepID=UPI0018AD2A44|nr:aminotransferase class III-fold pyridoxal phosphate-dependent enzyme [Sphingobium sp. Cam5-1]QPI74571.1 aminotransferase class III-fold pyridoxal phosphate-dependent enzyme [Sphingobium sp. Cam5-1]
MNDDDQSLLQRRRQVLGTGAPLFYDQPLHLVRGEGAWVFDADGRRYLDVYNNVPHVGHCHPHVVEAASRQLATLNINTRYLHDNVVDYAERLAATTDYDHAGVFFTCTGTESNELALRIARHVTGGTGIIASSVNYHGNSAVLASLCTAFPVPEPFPDFARLVQVPDPYRHRLGRSDAQLASHYLDEARGAIASLQDSGVKLAALLIDPSLANEGLPEFVPGYLTGLVELVRAAGGLVIADEVQSGFGRTGAAMWAHQYHGIIPDIITTGKPMGNGFPIGSVISTYDVIDEFGRSANYFNTFGGNPVATAAAAAVLDVIENEGLIANAATVGAYVEERLKALMMRHEIIGNVRCRGMFFGLELVADRATKQPSPHAGRIVNAMKDKGVLLSRIGPSDNILKMRPSMVFAREQADILLAALDETLEEMGC